MLARSCGKSSNSLKNGEVSSVSSCSSTSGLVRSSLVSDANMRLFKIVIFGCLRPDTLLLREFSRLFL